MAEKELETIAQKVKIARVTKGLNLEELAKRSGVTITTLSHIENGKYGARYSTLKKIADVLEVDVKDLL